MYRGKQHQNTTETLGRDFYPMTFCTNCQCGGESYDVSSPKSSVLRLTVEIKGSFWSSSGLKSKSVTTSGNSMCIGCSVIESSWLWPGDLHFTSWLRTHRQCQKTHFHLLLLLLTVRCRIDFKGSLKKTPDWFKELQAQAPPGKDAACSAVCIQ